MRNKKRTCNIRHHAHNGVLIAASGKLDKHYNHIIRAESFPPMSKPSKTNAGTDCLR